MDSSAYEYNKFINILDTFNFIQHINMPPHSSGHLLGILFNFNSKIYARLSGIFRGGGRGWLKI